jgi:hypothetical protein
LRRAALGLAAATVMVSLASCGSSSQPQKPPPDPRIAFEPTPGSYEYATKGFEKIDALLGARHVYPATTKVRVALRPCGYSERWNASSERWTRFDYCVSANGSRRLDALADFHEFFGYPEALNYRCSGGAIPPLVAVRKGFRWTNRCAGGSTDLVLRGKVVGHETIEVGSDSVAAVHLRIASRSEGKATGSATNDSWLAESNGLLVRRSVSGKATTRSPVGKVGSQERLKMRLKSLEPAAAQPRP